MEVLHEDVAHEPRSGADNNENADGNVDAVREMLKSSSLNDATAQSISVQEIAQIASATHRSDPAGMPVKPSRSSIARSGHRNLVRRTSGNLPGYNGRSSSSRGVPRAQSLRAVKRTSSGSGSSALNSLAAARNSLMDSGGIKPSQSGRARMAPRRTTSTDSALRAYRKDPMRRDSGGLASMAMYASRGSGGGGGDGISRSSLRGRGGTAGLNSSPMLTSERRDRDSRSLLRGRTAPTPEEKSVCTISDMDSVFSMDSVSLRKTQLIADPLVMGGTYHSTDSHACHDDTICGNLSRDDFDDDLEFANYIEYLPEDADGASVLSFATMDTLAGRKGRLMVQDVYNDDDGELSQSFSTLGDVSGTGDEFYDDLNDDIYDIDECGLEEHENEKEEDSVD